MANNWTKLTDVQGRIDADALQAFLEANQISVQLIQEGIGHYIYPVTFGELGRVEVFVPQNQLETAQALLEEYNASELMLEDEEIEEEEEEKEDQTKERADLP